MLPVLTPLRSFFPQVQGGGYLGLTVLVAVALFTLQAPLVVGLVSCLADAGPIRLLEDPVQAPTRAVGGTWAQIGPVICHRPLTVSRRQKSTLHPCPQGVCDIDTNFTKALASRSLWGLNKIF